MRVLELFELQPDEGPCLDCYRTGEPVLNQHLAAINGRWPRFAPVALAGGFRSVHALPMRLRGIGIGALNLLRADDGQLSEANVVAGRALADVASIAILQHGAVLEAHVLNEQLSGALNSRAVIEQAKGVLAERAGLDMEQAFTLLRNRPATATFDSPPSPKASWTGPSSPERLAPRDPRAAPEPHGREVEWRSPGQDP
jgi:ANTAR domain/GAF domain